MSNKEEMQKSTGLFERHYTEISYIVSGEEIKAMGKAAGEIKDIVFEVVAKPGELWKPGVGEFAPQKLNEDNFVFKVKFEHNLDGYKNWCDFKDRTNEIINESAS